MRIFVDTSAFLAVLNASDSNHDRARKVWARLVRARAELVCTNYVLAETLTLAQSRFGQAAVEAFQENVVPLLQIEWINENLHQEIVNTVLTAEKPRVSVVDATSFETVKRLKIDAVFAYDYHFAEQGFKCLG